MPSPTWESRYLALRERVYVCHRKLYQEASITPAPIDGTQDFLFYVDPFYFSLINGIIPGFIGTVVAFFRYI